MADTTVNLGGTEIPRLTELIKADIQTMADTFYRVGSHLSELKDEFQNLKPAERKALGNWKGYCQREFGFAQNYVGKMISGSIAYSNIEKSGTTVPLFPTNEGQLRPLTRFNDQPDTQVQLWLSAIDACDGEQPTESIVKKVVDAFLGKDKKKSEPVGEPILPDLSPVETEVGERFIKVGYRLLAKELHPDHGGSEEQMKALNLIKETFANFIKRNAAIEGDSI